MAKNIAIITACGVGTRFAEGYEDSNEIPKQYQKIAKIPVVRHSILAFLNHPQIDYVICVINQNHQKLYEEAVLGLDLLNPVFGGITRQSSVRSGLLAIENLNPDKVLIHDAVRPLISKAIISDVLAKLDDFPAAIPAVVVEDSLKKVAGDLIESNVERENLWRAQTPQAFRYRKILDAHLAYQNCEFNDDSALAEKAGIEVAIVPGSQNNFKITTFQDLQRANKLMIQPDFSALPQFRIGNGFDVHSFDEFLPEEARQIRIGGIDIPFEKKVIAVSDGDVAIHSLIDAILGALGEGDIGEHFPVNDKKWHNCDSRVMLADILPIIEKHQAKIVNIDLCLIAERPKILSFKDAMRAELARILSIKENLINIKATTTEKLGFLGRGEGIACQAAVLISLN